MSSTAAELIRAGAARLDMAGFDSPRLDAEVLLRHLLRLDRTRLFLRMHELVSPQDVEAFERLIDQRLTNLPVAYLTGEREFMGLPFKVGPGVLVPRPETETLVEWALAWIGRHHPATIVDAGTGSGAIILSVAKLLDPKQHPRLIGTDLSSNALAYGIVNRHELELDTRVHLVRGDLLTSLSPPVDLVLANLPYLRPDQMADNHAIQAEPEMALVSGSNGFEAIARLIRDLPRIISHSGAAIFEIDPDQAELALNLFATEIDRPKTSILQDLSGRDRFIIANFW